MKIVLMGRREVFTPTGSKFTLPSNGVNLVFPLWGAPCKELSFCYFRVRVQLGLKKICCSLALAKSVCEFSPLWN